MSRRFVAPFRRRLIRAAGVAACSLSLSGCLTSKLIRKQEAGELIQPPEHRCRGRRHPRTKSAS
jgi:hypothetical protein